MNQERIRLVPVEYLQKNWDKKEEEESDSDVQSVSSSEEEEVVQVVVNRPPQRIPAAVPNDNVSNSNKVNCLFCYGQVINFSKKPYHRRILNNTCLRLFKYICNHLDIEAPNLTLGGRALQKPPKESLLLPAYLPLCARCRELYYNNIYESFVTYEAAVLKLTDQIAACITRSIGTSAARNGNSVGVANDVQSANDNPVQDIFDAYEQSMNEHAVMQAVREFRQKVFEKNPNAEPPIEPSSYSKARGRPKVSVENQEVAADSSVQMPTAGPSTAASVQEPANLKNVIKIVRNRTDILSKHKAQNVATDRLNAVKREMDEGNDGIEIVEDESSKTDLNYYAVSNPSPGVIQIIPIAVGGKGQTIPGTSEKIQKRKRSNREDFQKQKIAMNTCKFCNKYFPGTLPLIKHQVSKHGMEKPEKCSKCDYRGLSKASLKSHMTVHLNVEEKERIKKFFCHICSLKFNTKNGLNNHLRSHSGEKPFVCDICEKKFTSNVSRQLCLDKHNGIKHHKCTHCDRTFLRREVLKIHERTHTGEKPFVCHICNKAFAQRSPLNIHLKMHKRKDPASYFPKPKKK